MRPRASRQETILLLLLIAICDLHRSVGIIVGRRPRRGQSTSGAGFRNVLVVEVALLDRADVGLTGDTKREPHARRGQFIDRIASLHFSMR